MQSHKTVLEKEAVAALALSATDTVVDATIGSGGHARRITESLHSAGTFVGIDTDEDAIKGLTEAFGQATCRVILESGNFKNIDSILAKHHIRGADAILADLGWRMEQFSGNGKGFSFMIDEPLIMTLGNPSDYSFTAKDIVNEWKTEDLKNVFKGYGEERYAKRIAEKIAEQRKVKSIDTTYELVEIIKDATPVQYHHGRIHPATKVFQALRIAVNDELETLEVFIKKAVMLLVPKGRLAIITFHSLEDRIVKHLFKQLAHDQLGTIITKKPLVPTQDEIKKNPRSRSAKLRIFEKK